MKLLAMLLLAASCMTLPEAYGIDASDKVKVDQEDAIHYVKSAYDVPELWDHDIPLYWSEELCPGTEREAVVYQGRCYEGWLNWNCTAMFVAWHGDVADSALVHEIGHCVRVLLGVHGDPKHEDTEFWEKNSEISLGLRVYLQ